MWGFVTVPSRAFPTILGRNFRLNGVLGSSATKGYTQPRNYRGFIGVVQRYRIKPLVRSTICQSQRFPVMFPIYRVVGNLGRITMSRTRRVVRTNVYVQSATGRHRLFLPSTMGVRFVNANWVNSLLWIGNYRASAREGRSELNDFSDHLLMGNVLLRHGAFQVSRLRSFGRGVRK